MDVMRFPTLQQVRRRLRRPRNGIVIGGCARSGTTLLLSVLSSHPEICAIPQETQIFCPTAYDPKPTSHAAIRPNLVDEYLPDRRSSTGCKYWCEKTPKNVRFFGRLIKELTRRIKLIHIVRDGRDVVVSRHPKRPDDYWVSPKRWIEDVTLGREVEHHARVLTIRYEDLVLNFKATAEVIGHFLQLGETSAFHDFPAKATIQKSEAWSSAIRPLDSGSIGRWKADEFTDRVDELMQDDRAVELLRHYHYL